MSKHVGDSGKVSFSRQRETGLISESISRGDVAGIEFLGFYMDENKLC